MSHVCAEGITSSKICQRRSEACAEHELYGHDAADYISAVLEEIATRVSWHDISK
jgi:hypothetical protein